MIHELWATRVILEDLLRVVLRNQWEFPCELACNEESLPQTEMDALFLGD